MAPKTYQLGLLDRMDAGGWLLLLAGVAVVTLVVLMPARLDVEDLEAQRDTLATQLSLLEARHADHLAFQEAVESGDPILLRRLGWHHLHLVPTKGPQQTSNVVAQQIAQAAPDQWQRPSRIVQRLPEIPKLVPRAEAATSRLSRLVTGRPRPWVLGLGIWLILMGVAMNPGAHAAASTTGPRR